MGFVDIVVPQMGEGLEEVRILQFLKKPKERVKRDEPIYEMETDKATVEVESPYDGTIEEWIAKVGDILAVGTLIGRIHVEGAAAAAGESEFSEKTAPARDAIHARGAAHPVRRAATAVPSSAAVTPETIIPPRTRTYCKQLGISEEEMRRIPSVTGKLLPEDVDRFVAEGKKQAQAEPQQAQASPQAPFREYSISSQQRILNFRLKRSAQLVIPANLSRPVEWGSIRKTVQAWKQEKREVQPSEFQTFAYCAAQAAKDHPLFRCALQGEDKVREFAHVNLGIAVQRDNGDLVLAVVTQADAQEFLRFVETAQDQIRAAREGQNQAADVAQLHLTYMGPFEILNGIPVLVAPAVGVIFVGSAYEQSGRLLANLSLTFDHRLINGVAAATFVNAIAERVKSVGPDWLQPGKKL